MLRQEKCYGTTDRREQAARWVQPHDEVQRVLLQNQAPHLLDVEAVVVVEPC